MRTPRPTEHASRGGGGPGTLALAAWPTAPVFLPAALHEPNRSLRLNPPLAGRRNTVYQMSTLGQSPRHVITLTSQGKCFSDEKALDKGHRAGLSTRPPASLQTPWVHGHLQLRGQSRSEKNGFLLSSFYFNPAPRDRITTKIFFFMKYCPHVTAVSLCESVRGLLPRGQDVSCHSQLPRTSLK